MRQAACHGNHLVVCTLRNISMTELIVDVIKCTPISASDTRTHVVVDVHKTVGDVHIRAWREGYPLPDLSDNGGMVVMMPLWEMPPLSVVRKPLDEPPAPFIAMSEPLPTEYDS